jgi:hypothetical protein
MSFSVPAELAPPLERRAWLQLGAIVVPLPAAGAIGAGGRSPPPDPEMLAERQLRGSELAVEHARRRAAEAEAAAAELAARIARLERELADARAEPERVRALLDERRRELTAAEQRVHAEQALRLEVQEQLAAATRAQDALRAALGELAGREARVRELEGELERARRAAAEAEHLAAARRAAPPREPAAVPPEPAPPPAPDRRVRTIRAELALAHDLPEASAPRSRPGPVPQPRLAALLAVERALATLWSAAPENALERERAARSAAERRVARLEQELAEQNARAARISAAIADLRAELQQLREEVAERPAPPTTPVEAERLSAALARLREATPAQPPPQAPPDDQPARPVRPWLRGVFRRLAAQDPATAGRLLIALLPAQHLADRRPVTYDLVLGDLACVQVTAGPGSARVEFAEGPRASSEVDFQISGDLASLARLVAARPLRRRLSRGLARVRGDRARLASLEHLISATLTLHDLHAAAVRLDPGLALTVVSLMVDPSWTVGERFTVAHEVPGARVAGAFLQVRDGRPLVVTDRPAPAPVDTTIVAEPDQLLPALAGDAPANVFTRGEQRPLMLIAHWLEHAQSG